MTQHDVLPFAFVFLAIAAPVEVSACLDHWLSERWLTAAMADLAVLLATWLVTNERGLPASYAPIPHAALLGAQVAQTMQCAVAFAISVGGGLQLTSHDGRVAPVLEVLMLGCADACYVVAFVRLIAKGRTSGTSTRTRRSGCCSGSPGAGLCFRARRRRWCGACWHSF